MPNYVRAISKDGGIVVCALDSTAIVREMERVHKTSAVVTAALGRQLTATSLMGSWLKSDEDSITVRINGGGPIGTMLTVTDGQGNVRGYADRPVVEIPLRADGKLDVGSAVGKEGTITVSKDLGMGEPYSGQVALVSGEIAEDITAYYAASEQTPTVCALGVLVNPDLTVRTAGGFLLQLLPGATDAEITRVEQNIAKIPSVTELLEKGGTPYDMVNLALDGFGPDILEEKDVAYKCYCSLEKSERILISLGREELQRLRDENPVATVECHFCDKKYEIPLDKLLAEISE